MTLCDLMFSLNQGKGTHFDYLSGELPLGVNYTGDLEAVGCNVVFGVGLHLPLEPRPSQFHRGIDC